MGNEAAMGMNPLGLAGGLRLELRFLFIVLHQPLLRQQIGALVITAPTVEARSSQPQPLWAREIGAWA